MSVTRICCNKCGIPVAFCKCECSALTEEQKKQIKEAFEKNLIENMQDSPPEFSETVDKHFWELVED